MYKATCISLMCLASVIQATQLELNANSPKNNFIIDNPKNIKTPIGMREKVCVQRIGEKWHVYNYDTQKLQPVAHHDVDQTLQNISNDSLHHLIDKNLVYLYLSRYQNGEYKLSYRGRIKGGGPATAYWFYTITKGAGYGAVAGSIVGGAVATGGVGAGAVTTATMHATGTGAAALAGGGAAGTVATGTATATAGTVGSAGAGVIASMGTQVFTAIEGAAVAAGALGAWLPTP